MDIVDQKGFEFVVKLASELSSGELSLPSFPDIAVRVRRVIEDPGSSMSHVVRVLNTEPVLTARIIKLSNSVLFNRGGGNVSDLHRAVARLGYNMVKNTSMSFAMQQIFQANSLGMLRPYLGDIWKHSIRVGAMSYVLASKLTRINPDQAFLAGVLHDIGKLYILMRAEFYPEIFSQEDALDELLHRWHTGIGKAILDAWGFDECISAAADEHEAFDRDHLGGPDMADVVLVANLHAHMGDQKYRNKVDWSLVTAFKRLKLNPDVSIAVMKESMTEIKSITSALS